MERFEEFEAGLIALKELLASSIKESNERSVKIDAQLAKTDAQLAKTDAQLAKTDAKLEKTIDQIALSHAKYDARSTKADAKLKDISIRLGNMGVNLGVVAEEFFYYSLKDKMKLGKIKFNEISFNLKGKNKYVEDEFDIVMINGKSVALIEIKLKVHPNDIETLKSKKVQNFKSLFQDYANYHIFLGIGGYSIPIEIENLAQANGIAVLRQKGEIAEIVDNKLVAY